MRHMAFAAPLDEAEKALKCVCQQWATSGSEKGEDNVGRVAEGGRLVASDEWFVLVLFQSNVSTVYVARAVVVVPSFTTELSRSSQRFYVNRAFQN